MITAVKNKLFSPDSLKQKDHTTYIVLMIAALFGLLFHVVLLVTFFFFELTYLVLINCISIALWGCVISQNNQGHYHRSTLIAAFEILVHSVICVVSLGFAFGFQLYLWPLAALLTFHKLFSYKQALFIGMLCIALYGLLHVYVQPLVVETPIRHISEIAYFSNAILAGLALVTCILAIRFFDERQEQRLNILATKDELTGLYNRRYFNSFLNQYAEKAKRDEEAYCLVMIDIDKFKHVNDKYGHETGDIVLKKVASFLKQHIRSSDVVCRWGGEEFLILLTNCELAAAVKIIEQIRISVAQNLAVIKDKDTITITLSAGIANSSTSETVDDLIRHSDELMYQAKMSGRNCIITP